MIMLNYVIFNEAFKAQHSAIMKNLEALSRTIVDKTVTKNVSYPALSTCKSVSDDDIKPFLFHNASFSFVLFSVWESVSQLELIVGRQHFISCIFQSVRSIGIRYCKEWHQPKPRVHKKALAPSCTLCLGWYYLFKKGTYSLSVLVVRWLRRWIHNRMDDWYPSSAGIFLYC